MPIQAYKLAKELDLAVKDLIERALEFDIVVKGNFSFVEDDVAERIRQLLKSKDEEAEARAAAEAQAAAAAQAAEEARAASEAQAAAERAAAEAQAAAERAAAEAQAALERAAEAQARKSGARAKGAGARAKKTAPAEPAAKPATTDAPAPAAAAPPSPPPVDLTPLIAEAAKAEADKAAAPKASLLLPIDLSARPKADLPGEAVPTKASILHLKEDAPEVRVLRPTEIDKFTREVPVEPEKEKRKVKPIPRAAGSGTPAETSRFRERPKFRREVRVIEAGGDLARRTAPLEREIEVALPISLKALSQTLGLKTVLLMRKLLDAGTPVTLNTLVAEDVVLRLAQEFKRKVKIRKQRDVEQEILGAEAPDQPEDKVPRVPVVTFLGHVDHGKTSLLDRIRQTNVAEKESGGITQHIGAWKISRPGGGGVVFLDTPGHEAFTAMRARGAHVTDVAVLVVAADDGVMPQTEEAVNHARAAGVPIVVALNKIDKKEANLHRVKSQLSALGLVSEDWGGNTQMVEVSALTGQGVDKLVEMLALEAEMLELRSNPKRPARGVILEAKRHETRGVLATALVQDGTLRKGDAIVCGTVHGRVRALYDHLGQPLDAAGPATPVELLGLTDLPSIGEPFRGVSDLSAAKALVGDRQRRERPTLGLAREAVTLENLFGQIEAGKVKEARIILKADVKGSAEVLLDAFNRLSTAEVRLRTLHAGIGNVNESDVVLADASKAIVIGFNVNAEERAKAIAQEKRVDIRHYQVIYHAVEDMKAALEGLLEPEEVEVVTGHLTVKQVFRVSRLGNIAGCFVTDGKIERTSHTRLVRAKEVVYTGRVESLKRFKDDAREVTEGFECGVRLAGHDDIREGDTIEVFQIQHVAKKLK